MVHFSLPSAHICNVRPSAMMVFSVVLYVCVCVQMSSCSSRALTLLSTVFGACGLLLVGVAVATDYWLLMEEGIVMQQNQTVDVKMALHSGLWRVCFIAGANTRMHNCTHLGIRGDRGTSLLGLIKINYYLYFHTSNIHISATNKHLKFENLQFCTTT